MIDNQQITVAFLGDISLNDNYILLNQENYNPFNNLAPNLSLKDFVVGNLECLLKGDHGENELKKPRLHTTIETLDYLNKIHLKVATLANNHVYDHLEDGFIKTTEFLKENNIQFIGAGTKLLEAEKPLIITKNGIRLGVLNYVTKDTNPNLPENAIIELNYFDIEKVKKDIELLKKTSEHVVLSLHWGGRVEGGLYPDWGQPKTARILIDAGADLIIGHHSHTFQPYEIYKGKYIFYSLGNFCFSDYHFESKFFPMPLRRRVTCIVNITFKKDDYNVDMDFYLNDIKSFVPYNCYRSKVKRRNFIFKFLFRFKLIWNIYFIHKIYVLPLLLFLFRKDISFLNKNKRLFNSILKRIT